MIYFNYITGLGLVLWYIEIRLDKYRDYLTGFRRILWYIENTWTNLLDSDWFYCNQAEMMLEKYVLELSVEQLVLQSNLEHNQVYEVWFPYVGLCLVFEKPNFNAFCSKVRHTLYPTRVIQV